MKAVFRTRLCNLLGIDYPILQSGMGRVAGADLTAEVSRAGGLGILAGSFLSADQAREAIRQVRAKTDRPFGVNLLIPNELNPPREDFSPAVVAAVRKALNSIRASFNMPAAEAAPSPPPPYIQEVFEVILEERVPVFSIGLGDPGAEMVRECHNRGMKVIAMVTTAADARKVESAGIDAVVAQGSEAGGHRSHFAKPASPQTGSVGTLALIPEVAAAVGIPVIAAGGISDGRGVAASLALGAAGALLGTRFVATRESLAHPAYKQALLEKSGADTAVTDVLSGRYARAVSNEFVRRYEASGAPVLPFMWHALFAQDIYQAAAERNEAAFMPMWAGQGIGSLRDLPAAAEVVAQIVHEVKQVLTEAIPRAVELS